MKQVTKVPNETRVTSTIKVTNGPRVSKTKVNKATSKVTNIKVSQGIEVRKAREKAKAQDIYKEILTPPF